MHNKATTPFHIWKSDLLALAGVTACAAQHHAERISLWFDMGESAEAASDMLKAFTEQRAKAIKPSDIAVRWFRDGSPIKQENA